MNLKHTIALVSACLVGGLGMVNSSLAVTPDKGMGEHGMSRMHGAHHLAKMQAHLATLKTKLIITADQEAAWAAFAAAMQPPANTGEMSRDEAKKMHAEMQKLTTPERITRMKAMHADHLAKIDKLAGAVTTLYAALTPVQRAVFDAWPMAHRGLFGRMAHHQ